MDGKGSLCYSINDHRPLTVQEEESIAAEPAFQSALQAATGNETEIAKLHTKHLSDFGGYYFADVFFHVPVHAPVHALVPVPYLIYYYMYVYIYV